MKSSITCEAAGFCPAEFIPARPRQTQQVSFYFQVERAKLSRAADRRSIHRDAGSRSDFLDGNQSTWIRLSL